MNLRAILAILLCKFLRFVSRVLHRGGTAMPGRFALKVCPNLLSILSRDVKTVAITGTNGKTTSSRMVEQAFADAGLSYFANRSGANLISGITTEFVMNSTLGGKPKKEYAVIECDEAAARRTFGQLRPKVVMVTNLFRDQLDRYGEVTHTRNNIKIGIEHSPNAQLCLNADDSLTASLAEEVPNPVLYYGVNTPIYRDRVQELSDAPYCLHCKHAYTYDYVTYGHLGGYRCPACGYCRPSPRVYVQDVLTSDAEHSEVDLVAGGETYRTNINLPGGYNIYNACACMAAGQAMELDAALISKSLSEFACGFGRMEKFEIGGTSLRMILIKNPAGCNQVLNFLTQTTEPFLFVCCLNDRAQDGKDVSWIWDVDFERIAALGDRLSSLLVSGVRAEDMAVRFKYAGVPVEKIQVIKDYPALVQACVRQDKPVFIMPTYTAMLELRTVISKNYGFKAFWE